MLHDPTQVGFPAKHVGRFRGTAEGPRAADGRLPATEFLVNNRNPAVGAPMTAP
ncbi:hypothetical protein ACFPM7_06450 [Actinokineospora guangxiensis]|uniref:Uncharacterized protein n=1 Tax=Actinokineospora guangxiensis TaxID=1490288 RepID=A0ABW0EL74_9PSEU